MITLTFEPTCPEQAAMLGKFLPEYMKAGQLKITGEAADVAQAVETAAAEIAAPKRTRAAKPAPAAAQDSASVTGTSATTNQPDPTPTATTAATEGNAAAEPSAPEAPAAPAASSEGSAKQWTLEEVRARLAELSKAGKQQQVVAIIAGLGAKKLTDVPADKYAHLMQEAEAL
jgi:hypothetical protein